MRFKRALKNLPPEIRQKVKKTFELFRENPRHPSFHTKKVKGLKNIWEGRIDINYRFLFRYDGDTVVFLNIGPHDIIDEETSSD
jgi:mRNA-degrading endonuclease RelE of RelBE toxin-antitoxin system